MKKKILILGNSAKESALAKLLSVKYDVYAAPGNDGIKEFANCLDIRENSVNELLEFALENSIDLTIAFSLISQLSGIAEIFNQNGLKIFSPGKDALKILADKTFAKKLMYKLRIPTPKFGIFEKQSMAYDYVKNFKSPFVIKTNEPSSAVILTKVDTAKNVLDSVFCAKQQKVIVEDFIYGTPFSFYAITDGYKALPIGSSILYKHLLEGGGGQLTSGMGACSPNYKLSFDNEEFLMNNVIYPTLAYIENTGSSYVGILGVKGILSDEGEIKILGYQTSLNDCDASGILGTLDTDIVNLFDSCIVGSFSDDYEYIYTLDKSAVSVVLYCGNLNNKENVIQGLSEVDDNIEISFYPNIAKNKYLEFEAQYGQVLLLTAFARTVTEAAGKVYEEIKNINFNGMKYRKDICKSPTYTLI